MQTIGPDDTIEADSIDAHLTIDGAVVCLTITRAKQAPLGVTMSREEGEQLVTRLRRALSGDAGVTTVNPTDPA